MTTAVASPPSFQPISRLGWNASGASPSGLSSMSADDVSRMLMPQRKAIPRTNSSSSIASSSSSTSTVTSIQTNGVSSPASNGDNTSQPSKKKTRGGFWPAKSEPTAALSSGRANGLTGTSTHQPLPTASSQPSVPAQLNGARPLNAPSPMEQTAVLALLPMNGTFERKQINVPFFPDVLRIGRQTNAKTVPTPSNGYFDSKVLSRQHAELWAERNGKVWIRDVKSSNGTFVNGQRLSAENRDSEPHELRQHDTLELGIDIVSEDQKTIVHHKVSAKVEYVGLPGSSNNVMDLNFGDLDPSHGGALLPAPISTPMIHSRSKPGGALGSGRSTPASSVISTNAPSLAQQRQFNFWGTPLNVEQLVKTLSTEMRAARQQSQDLDQASALLNSFLSPDAAETKTRVEAKDPPQQRQQTGRARPLKVDSATRFAEPPAPPPQQPLPEKPDVSRSSPMESSSFSFLKRSDTAKPPTGTAGPSHSPQNSQILSLVEALSIAKKELDSQGAKVKQLEEMLRQERSARENAEEKARRLEQHISSSPISQIESDTREVEVENSTTTPLAAAESSNDDTDGSASASAENDLQQRLESMVLEMQRMKADMDNFQRRAEVAEDDASKARLSLSEMIAKLRRENEINAADTEPAMEPEALPFPLELPKDLTHDVEATKGVSQTKNPQRQANGHIRTSSKLPEALERAVATVLRDGGGNADTLAQTAPYVSMLGVVLIGVGLMAYLNSWQKTEK